MQVEAGASFRRYYLVGEREESLNVEAMNEWLNDVGASGRTLMESYSGEEIDLFLGTGSFGEELQISCPSPSFVWW